MRERVHADAPSVRHSGMVDRAELVVTCVVDEAEHRSRVRRGIGSVENEFFLAALMSVPADTLGYVTPRFASALCSHSAAPMASVVEDPDGGLWARRELAEPVTVQEIEFATSSCARGVAAAHRWVGYGPRVVRAARPVSPLELTEAAHYGIGVISPDGQRVLEPQAYRPGRWSSARWRFAEIIYGQIRHAREGR